jgi:hypothetical protein
LRGSRRPPTLSTPRVGPGLPPLGYVQEWTQNKIGVRAYFKQLSSIRTAKPSSYIYVKPYPIDSRRRSKDAFVVAKSSPIKG